MTTSLSDLASAAKNAPANAQQAIDEGEALYQRGQSIVDQVSSGDYAGAAAGLAGAAIGLLYDVDFGQITPAVDALVKIGQSAATGAAAGGIIGTFIFPGIGTAVGAAAGAVVGAAVQAAEDIFPLMERDNFNPIAIVGDLANDVAGAFGINLSGNPPQIDYRYYSERFCFPAYNGDQFYGVMPGMMHFNPRSKPANSGFQVPSSTNSWFGTNVEWSMAYTFTVGGYPVVGSTPQSKAQGWALMQLYLAQNAVTGSKGAPAQTALAKIRAQCQGVFGSVSKMEAAYDKLCGWYGDPASFSTALPFSSTGGNPPDVSHTPDAINRMMATFTSVRADWLYYPILSLYENQQFGPCAPLQATDVMVTPDTIIMPLAEGAALGWSDTTAAVFMIGMQHKFVTSRQIDSKRFTGLPVTTHDNFSRILGNISYRIRETPKLSTKTLVTVPASLSPSSLSTPAPPSLSTPVPRTPSRPAIHAPISPPFPVAYAALAAGAFGAMVVWKRKRSRKGK